MEEEQNHDKGQLQQHIQCHCQDATMEQVQALWDLTCIGGNLGWYIAIELFPYCALMCHGEMLFVREAMCFVACCAGASVPVQACWGGGAHPVQYADAPY